VNEFRGYTLIRMVLGFFDNEQNYVLVWPGVPILLFRMCHCRIAELGLLKLTSIMSEAPFMNGFLSFF
jgi:hypothetical protein